jgi:hypothetical protein
MRGQSCAQTRARWAGPRNVPLMRSVFPALHDRHLTALLFGGALLLAVAIFAISVMDREPDGSGEASAETRRAMIRVTGASPAN